MVTDSYRSKNTNTLHVCLFVYTQPSKLCDVGCNSNLGIPTVQVEVCCTTNLHVVGLNPSVTGVSFINTGFKLIYLFHLAIYPWG